MSMTIGSRTVGGQGKCGPDGDRAQSPCNAPRNWRNEGAQEAPAVGKDPGQ